MAGSARTGLLAVCILALVGSATNSCKPRPTIRWTLRLPEEVHANSRITRALELALPRETHSFLVSSAGESHETEKLNVVPPPTASSNAERFLQLAGMPIEVRIRMLAQGQTLVSPDRPDRHIVLRFPTATGSTFPCGNTGGTASHPFRPCFEVMIVDSPDGAVIATLAHELLVHVRRSALGLPDAHLTPNDEISTEARQVEAEARQQALSSGRFSNEALNRARASRDAFVRSELEAVPMSDRPVVAELLRARFDLFDWANF
jgi:hypothetical protein